MILKVIFVTEPTRGAKEKMLQEGLKAETTLIKDVKYLATNKTVVFCTMGFAAVTYVVACISWWGPSFIEYAYLSQG